MSKSKVHVHKVKHAFDNIGAIRIYIAFLGNIYMHELASPGQPRTCNFILQDIPSNYMYEDNRIDIGIKHTHLISPLNSPSAHFSTGSIDLGLVTL